ncbi:hypothetical protein F511_39210 [Dorcoceras hygrometricum]|uniref:CMP/dCMP-type deaminase domain-containing protein n=1 Tax=Dorcoceras hygrometricum TaxID=472368 RepID=A0A2Z7A0I9_9LAMI|nr:hypothetical protein F511_39210 [Dorcoceras hygrometricum]
MSAPSGLAQTAVSSSASISNSPECPCITPSTRSSSFSRILRSTAALASYRLPSPPRLVVTADSSCRSSATPPPWESTSPPIQKIVQKIHPPLSPYRKFYLILFGPHDLLDQETPLLLESHHNRLDLLPSHDDSNPINLCNGNSNAEKLSNGNCEKHDPDEARLKESALEAANSAHAPYSGCPSGVALMDCEGKVYRGSYIESAAFNPSLGPVQAALVAYVAGGGGGYERIVAAALVEQEVAKVRQEDTARMILKAISPKWGKKIELNQIQVLMVLVKAAETILANHEGQFKREHKESSIFG